MDELKLNKWKEDFIRGIRDIEIEFNSYLINADLSQFYSISVKETSEELSLSLKDGLPNELSERITKIFLATKPEDSV